MKSFIALVLFVLVSTTAYAEPAEVLDYDGFLLCFGVDQQVGIAEVSFHQVTTYSETDRKILTAHGICDAPLADKALHWDNDSTGYVCTWDIPYFKMVVTKNGQYALKCQNWPFPE